VFHFDVAKVYQDVAHVEVAIHVCFKCMFRMFHLFLPDVCLQALHLDVAYVSASVSDVYSKCFGCFYMYVASVFIWMFRK
jgi:hypothetical protein